MSRRHTPPRATVAAFTPGVTTVDRVFHTLGPPIRDIVTADGNRSLKRGAAGNTA